MNNRKGFVPLVLIAITVFILLGTAVFLKIKNSTPFISLQAISPSPIVPTPSSSRGISVIQSTTTGRATGTTHGLRIYPDKPIDFNISKTITVTMLIEHRSALNEKTVSVNAVVINAKQGWCPAKGSGIMLRCSESIITIADTMNDNRNKDYDVILSMGELDISKYSVGQRLTFKAAVYADTNNIILRMAMN